MIPLFVFSYAKENYPWTLKPIYEIHMRCLIHLDIDNDGIDEIAECVGPYVYVKDQKNIIKKQLTFNTERFSPIGTIDLDG